MSRAFAKMKLYLRSLIAPMRNKSVHTKVLKEQPVCDFVCRACSHL